MKTLLCDSGPLIASYNRRDPDHERCTRLLARWPGRLLVPEPVLGETCNFLRNNVRGGAALEAQFLAAATRGETDIEIVDPIADDRRRAAELVAKLVTGPLGYVDATLIAIAERLQIADIATVDFKLLGMAVHAGAGEDSSGSRRRNERHFRPLGVDESAVRCVLGDRRTGDRSTLPASPSTC